MSILIIPAVATALFALVYYDQRMLRSDLGEPPLPNVRACPKILGKAIKIMLWILVGVPLVIAVIALCFIWPPMLALVVIALCLWAFCYGIIHPNDRARPYNYPPASNNDLLTGIVVGAIISESYHHHHD